MSDEWRTATSAPLMANTLLMTSTTSVPHYNSHSNNNINYSSGGGGAGGGAGGGSSSSGGLGVADIIGGTLINRMVTTLAPEFTNTYTTANMNGINETDAASASTTSATDTDTATVTVDLINNEFVQIFFCIIYMTVFVLGVFGNVLVCYVVIRNRAMQTVTNIFITNLALSDILLCVLAVPFTPLYTFMGRWAFGHTLCHLVSFAQGSSIYISTLTLTSIAIDRYFVIIYPFHPRMNLSTCIAIIISIWIVALLATLPYGMYMKMVEPDAVDGGNTTNGFIAPTLMTATGVNMSELLTLEQQQQQQHQHHYNASISSFGYPSTSHNDDITYDIINVSSTHRTIAEAYKQIMVGSSSMTVVTMPEETASVYPPSTTSYCEENWPSEQYRKVFGSVTAILQFVLPFIVISICYIWISLKLNARARAKPGTKSSRREEADRDRKKRTNRMLISMVGVFGLSWLPLTVVNIFDDFYVHSNEWRYYTLIFFVSHWIAMSSTCYNPFLYAWLNENFRKEFKHVLPCFNPSNNHLLSITRGYNRSERNTCGPRLYHGKRDGRDGSGGGGGGVGDGDDADGGRDGSVDVDDNGVTQETSVLTGGGGRSDKLLIIPREPTYGKSGSPAGSFHAKSKSSDDTDTGIALSDNERLYHCRRAMHDHDIDSGDEEQTVEVKFCETNFNGEDLLEPAINTNSKQAAAHGCINFKNVDVEKQQ